MRKFLVLGLVVLAALAGTLVLFRGPIALRIVARGLEQNMAGSRLTDLGPGLHVILCGAGGPLPDPVRSGPCVGIAAGEAFFVVDAGSGAARSLARLRLGPNNVDGVLLTHFHSDHIDGLGELAMLRWTAGNHAKPLPVYGAPGAERVVDGFNRSYAQDVAYRHEHHGDGVAKLSGAGSEARVFPTPTPGKPTLVLDEGGLVVHAFAVDHHPVHPAVGYRFEYAGRSVVVSGDTKRSQELLEQSRGVDLLVHEALSAKLVSLMHDAAKDVGNRVLMKVTADIPDYHTTPVEAAEIAEAAGASHLLYYHVVPPLPVPGLATVFLDGVSDAYSGPVTLGQDGTMISLPAGEESLHVTQL